MVLILLALGAGLCIAALPEEDIPDHEQVMTLEEMLEAAKKGKSQQAESAPAGRSGGKERLPYEDDGSESGSTGANWMETVGDTPKPRKLDPKTQAAVDRVVDFFLRTYGQALQNEDWITRAVAVVSINRIKHPKVTEKLMEVLQNDTQPFVQVYAWEALYGRQGELSEDQLRTWRDKGMALATRDKVLNGELRVHLLEAIGHQGPSDEARKLFKYYFVNTNLEYPADKPLLSVMGDTLAKWNDKKLAVALVSAMGNRHACYRADYILRRLNPDVPTVTQMHKSSDDLLKGWAEMRQAYVNWVKNRDWSDPNSVTAPARPVEPAWMRDKGVVQSGPLLDRPEPIPDPYDKKWTKDLELPRFMLDSFYVTLLIDSTGSMELAVEWVKHDVRRLMRALKAISREPAIGVVFYRDKGEAYVVRRHEMTSNVSALAKELRAATAKGGGDFPEAVYEAVNSGLKDQKWPKTKSVPKYLILIGDAPPHKKSMRSIHDLLTTAAKENFRFHAMHVSNQYDLTGRGYRSALASAKKYKTAVPLSPTETFMQMAKWGKGEYFDVQFQQFGEIMTIPDFIPGNQRGNAQDPYRKLVETLMQELLNNEYRDRVEPFVAVLLEILQESPPEMRIYPDIEKLKRYAPDDYQKRQRYSQDNPTIMD